MNICRGVRDAVVPPSRSLCRSSSVPSSSLLRRSSSSRSKFNLSTIKSAVGLASSSEMHEDIMFVIHGNNNWYEFQAFNKKGKPVPKFCFTLSMSATSLPKYAGFAAVGSTLYILGGMLIATSYDSNGRDFTHLVPCRQTYMIDFHDIPHFENNVPANALESELVRRGPLLHASRIDPIVIVVGLKIYLFSTHLHLKDSPKFEVLDTGGPEPEWDEFSMPHFQDDWSGVDFESKDVVLEMDSHTLCEERSCIVICVRGTSDDGFFSGVYELDVITNQWRFRKHGVVPFFGKAISISLDRLFHIYVSFCHPRNLPDNTIGFFLNPLKNEGEERTDIKSASEDVSCHPMCEIGKMGDTFYVARTGYSPERLDRNHNITLDKFQVTAKGGILKVVNFRRFSGQLKYTGARRHYNTLYCVSLVQSRNGG